MPDFSIRLIHLWHHISLIATIGVCGPWDDWSECSSMNMGPQCVEGVKFRERTCPGSVIDREEEPCSNRNETFTCDSMLFNFCSEYKILRQRCCEQVDISGCTIDFEREK